MGRSLGGVRCEGSGRCAQLTERVRARAREERPRGEAETNQKLNNGRPWTKAPAKGARAAATERFSRRVVV